jgi:V8-like Glu-specific endopeptidase
VGIERDMAFLTLRTPIGDQTGWMDLDPTFKQGYANLSGYPAPGGRSHPRLTNDVELAWDDPLDAITNVTAFEAHPGNSGGPLWHYGSNGRPAVVGIVSSGINGKGTAAYDISSNYASILGWIASNDNLIA